MRWLFLAALLVASSAHAQPAPPPSVSLAGGSTIANATGTSLLSLKNNTTNVTGVLSFNSFNPYEVLLTTNGGFANSFAIQNDQPTGYSAITFRQVDQVYTNGGVPYEHMAIGYGSTLSFEGIQGFNYLESSRYTTTADAAIPPSRFLFQQTGGACSTGANFVTANLTSGSATATLSAGGNWPSGINGQTVFWEGYRSNAAFPLPTTIVSGEGTATITFSNTSLVTDASALLQICAPVYRQFLTAAFHEVGPIDFYGWANQATPFVRIDRNNLRLGVGSGYTRSTMPFKSLDVIGDVVFGSTAPRNSNYVNAVINLADTGQNGFSWWKNGTNTLLWKWPATTSHVDFIDVNNAKTMFSMYLDNTGGTLQGGITMYPGAVKTTPTTGGTVTFAASQRLAIIVPAGTLAALTVTLPACAAANDGDERSFLTTQAITSLTVGAGAGSVVAPATSATAGSGHAYHCYGADTAWYQMN